MNETHLPPPAVLPACSPSVKLSDLNAVKQQIVTRAGITLTAIGLLATASGTIGQQLPDLCDAASCPYPLGVYVATLTLPFGAICAIRALNLSADLQSVLITRLKATEGHPDAVSPELQSLFVENIELCLQDLNVAKGGFVYGCTALLLHVYLKIVVYSTEFYKAPAIIRDYFSSNISDSAVNYYFTFTIIFLGVVGFDVQRHFRSRKARSQKTPALLPLTKVPDRP